jgi:succinate dehydrogenase / fumarate reductase cytochrome b subunit
MSNTPPAAGEANGDRTGRYVRHPNGHVAPMSPFTDVWRWHMTMTASILFRVTIGAASVGAVLLLGWIAALATGAEVYAQVLAFAASPFGLFIWFGLTWVLFSFLLNGARHLINDTGAGLDLKTANLMAHVAVWGPIVLAVLFWVVLFASGRVSL